MPSSLVVQTSFIGDVILTTPLIAKLAATGPVDVLTTPVGATVLANNPHVRHIVVYDKRGANRGVTGFAHTVLELHRLRRVVTTGSGHDEPCSHTHDWPAYFAQGSIRSALLAVAAGYTHRTGFTTSSAKHLYTHRVIYRDDWHHARRLLSLADEPYAATVDAAALQPHLYPGPEDVTAVDTLLRGRDPSRPLIALAPGSVWATKRWPHYALLARYLASTHDIALLGTHADSETAAEIFRTVPPLRIINALGKLSLLGSAELLRRVSAVVTNDSAPQHLASAMGIPTITLFGPTVPAFGFGPLAPNSRTLGHDSLSCRPCDRHGPRQCPLGHWRCMRELSPETVYDAVQAVTVQSPSGILR